MCIFFLRNFAVFFLLLVGETICRVTSQLEYDKDGDLSYNGNVYYRADDRFEVRTGEGDKVIELGWRSQFPFFPNMHYYAFDEENPLFILCDNGKSTLYNKGLYLRSDYDLYNEVYAVDNTDIEISLSAAMTKIDVEVSAIYHEASLYLTMFLKDNSNIQVEMAGPYPVWRGMVFCTYGRNLAYKR